MAAMTSFQYPQSDRAHCNDVLRRHDDGLPHFQYPQSDRAHCNCSSTPLARAKTTYFQYPQSDRAHCNSDNATPHWLIGGSTFQYPQSDRAHCNWYTLGRNMEREALSVSSVGSSPLQQAEGAEWKCSACQLSVSSVGSSPLQRAHVLLHRHPAVNFQYPQSDRAHCNDRGLRDPAGGLQSFSILSRIEPTATLAGLRSLLGRLWAFSILSRIEPTATMRASQVLTRCFSLSVSSVGSSPLQLPETPLPTP